MAIKSRKARLLGLELADDRRHAHVFAALEGDDGAQHRQLQEQDGCQLVGPHERLVKHVAARHARQQDDDLGEHQQRGRDFDQRGQAPCSGSPARRSAARQPTAARPLQAHHW